MIVLVIQSRERVDRRRFVAQRFWYRVAIAAAWP
jgi:hypothetical protein